MKVVITLTAAEVAKTVGEGLPPNTTLRDVSVQDGCVVFSFETVEKPAPLGELFLRAAGLPKDALPEGLSWRKTPYSWLIVDVVGHALGLNDNNELVGNECMLKRPDAAELHKALIRKDAKP